MQVYFILLSSKNSTIVFIAHTPPAANIPSKKIEDKPFNPNLLDIPPKQIEKKKPTHVEVHKTQLINPDKNLPKKLKGINWLFPHLWIPFLSPLNIDPYTKIVVIP